MLVNNDSKTGLSNNRTATLNRFYDNERKYVSWQLPNIMQYILLPYKPIKYICF